MKARELSQLMANVGQLINLVKSVNINKEAEETHVSTLREAQAKLDAYTKQYENKEFMKTLSPAEQQNLISNAQNMYMFHSEVKKEMDYLDILSIV